MIQPLLTSLICLSLASGSLAQTTVTLDGASGSQTFNVPRTTLGGLTLGLGFEVEYLVVGGGGGGGNGYDDGPGGGGGAGGLLQGANIFGTATSIGVAVGAGGSANSGNGGNSSFGSIIALGGGGGGGSRASGLNGGSGGGAGGRPVGGTRNGGTASIGQGNSGGGNSGNVSGEFGRGGGGGGGAGSAGASSSTRTGAAGGAGLSLDISGTDVSYAVGGSGGSGGTGAAVNASIIGGGGRGAFGGNNGGSTQSGGQGANGIVIARYKGTSAGTGGTVTAGTGTAAGYTLHTFTSTGASALDLSSLDLSTRLGAVENGVISGSGDLTFTGPGTLTLNASNIYTGTTRVNAGTLALGSAGSVATSAGIRIAQGARFDVSGLSGGFSLGASQTLAGSGTVAGNTTIASGGTLAPGNSPGVLTIEGATTFSTASIFEWELDTAQSNPTTNRGVAYDGVNTTSVSGSGAIFKIMLTGTQEFSDGFWSQTRVWTDIFKSADGTTALSDWASVFSGGLQYAYNGQSAAPTSSGSFVVSGNTLTWTAVPEPSNLLAGLLAASAMLRRRRRD